MLIKMPVSVPPIIITQSKQSNDQAPGLIIAIAFVWWISTHDRPTETTQPTPPAVAEVKPEPVTPEEYVRVWVHDRDAEVRVTVDDGVAYVTYNISPWATSSTSST